MFGYLYLVKMLTGRIIFFEILLYFFIVGTASAQSSLPYRGPEFLKSSEAFLNNQVNKIFQDSTGFIWFVTPLGLHRYDGYGFKSYGYDPSDSNSFSGDLGPNEVVQREGKF